MARALTLQTLAEGIEDGEQQSILSGLGCQRSQGFLYARPLPPEDFISFIASFEPADVTIPPRLQATA